MIPVETLVEAALRHPRPDRLESRPEFFRPSRELLFYAVVASQIRNVSQVTCICRRKCVWSRAEASGSAFRGCARRTKYTHKTEVER